jgi:hypothetical protein
MQEDKYFRSSQQASATSPRARSPLQNWKGERRGGSLADPRNYSLLTSCTPR